MAKFSLMDHIVLAFLRFFKPILSDRAREDLRLIEANLDEIDKLDIELKAIRKETRKHEERIEYELEKRK